MVLTGVMKFEAKKFRPREVVKHVLHLGLASLHNKNLVLEGRIFDDVPLELIGDVLRIRQVFTNLVRYSILLACSTLSTTFLFLFPVLFKLSNQSADDFSLFAFCSNAIKFTHEGSVSINIRIVTSTPAPVDGAAKNAYLPARNYPSMSSTPSAAGSEESSLYRSRPKFVTALQGEVGYNTWPPSPDMKSRLVSHQSAPAGPSTSRGIELNQGGTEDVVLLCCDVCDTGIGIPGKNKEFYSAKGTGLSLNISSSFSLALAENARVDLSGQSIHGSGWEGVCYISRTLNK